MDKFIQVNIKVDKRLYPEEAETLLELRNNRKVQKAFREFLKTYGEREKQLFLELWGKD